MRFMQISLGGLVNSYVLFRYNHLEANTTVKAFKERVWLATFVNFTEKFLKQFVRNVLSDNHLYNYTKTIIRFRAQYVLIIEQYVLPP